MEKKTPVVFFNASVILAGLFSQKGGSGKLLQWTKKKKILGIISEIIFDEVLNHTNKIKLSQAEARKKILKTFKITKAPRTSTVNLYKNFVIDLGDCHVLASAKEIKADYLVTLDKKHLLVLQKKIKKVKIVSPKQLIEKLSL